MWRGVRAVHVLHDLAVEAKILSDSSAYRPGRLSEVWQLSVVTRQAGSCPAPRGRCQGRSPSAFCRSTIGPDAITPRCTRASRHPGRPATPRSRRRSSCGTPPVELVQHGLVEALCDSVRLRALGLGAAVIDVLDREIELVFVPLRVAAILRAPVGEDAQQRHAVLVEEGDHPVVQKLGRADRRFAVIELGEGDLDLEAACNITDSDGDTWLPSRPGRI